MQGDATSQAARAGHNPRRLLSGLGDDSRSWSILKFRRKTWYRLWFHRTLQSRGLRAFSLRKEKIGSLSLLEDHEGHKTTHDRWRDVTTTATSRRRPSSLVVSERNRFPLVWEHAKIKAGFQPNNLHRDGVCPMILCNLRLSCVYQQNRYLLYELDSFALQHRARYIPLWIIVHHIYQWLPMYVRKLGPLTQTWPAPTFVRFVISYLPVRVYRAHNLHTTIPRLPNPPRALYPPHPPRAWERSWGVTRNNIGMPGRCFFDIASVQLSNFKQAYFEERLDWNL